MSWQQEAAALDGRVGGLTEGSAFLIGSSSARQKKHCLPEVFLSLIWKEKIYRDFNKNYIAQRQNLLLEGSRETTEAAQDFGWTQFPSTPSYRPP